MPYINYQMSDFEMWAVTLSAPCYRTQAASMELVAGLRRFPATKRRICAELMDTYGQGIAQLNWKGKYTLSPDFHRNIQYDPCAARYNEMRHHMLAAPGNITDYILSLPDGRSRRQASLVSKTLFLLPAGGIYAYNAARSIYYIRCRLLLGNMDPKIAMSNIMGVAKPVQQIYDSWEEYFTAFAIGEHFVSENPDAALSIERTRGLIRLMTGEHCAARYLSWHMRL